MLIPEKYRIGRSKLLKLLDELKTCSEPGVSIYLPSGDKGVELKKVMDIFPVEETLPVQIGEYLSKSTTGAIFFYGKSHKYLILPPFPVSQKLVVFEYATEKLRELLNRNFKIAVVIVRLGAYGIGLFQGQKLLVSKVGTGLVHSRHKKGGSSQRRFERHREKQIEFFFNNVCIRVKEKLEPYLQQIDYLFYGGEKNTIQIFRTQCHFLKKLDDRVMYRVLNVREPKSNVITSLIHDIWSSEIIEWKQSASS